MFSVSSSDDEVGNTVLLVCEVRNQVFNTSHHSSFISFFRLKILKQDNKLFLFCYFSISKLEMGKRTYYLTYLNVWK